MLETKSQKVYFGVSMVVVLVLVCITVFQKSDFRYKDTTDYAKLQQQSEAEQKAYAVYLASIQTDPVASQELFQSILTQADIRQEVEAQLKTSQPVVLPTVDQKTLNLTSASGQKAVEAYFTAAIGPLVAFSQNTSDLNKQLFTDPNSAATISKEYNQAFRKLTAAPVPKEALPAQTALVSAYISYGRLLDLSKQYTSGQNTQPWADTYQNYAAINQSFQAFTAAYNQLVGKYHLADETIYYAQKSGSHFVLIPEARAVFGLGDVTITVGDIPRIIMDTVQQGLVSSFTQFMASFLEQMVQKIESNYKIANFLYYSDALVSGQYANDYLNKYVDSSLDQNIIKQLIPQFSCNKQNQNLKPIFQAKASQYLGFDPSSLNPSDPNYYQKLASVGNFMASSNGQELYYQDLAAQTESAAQAAADRELTSNGLKSPRDALNGGIATSVNAIAGGEQASLNEIMQLGNSNAGSFISQFVAQISQTLFTKFLFSGATVSPRSPSSGGVLKEQATCLAAAQLAPIVPITGTPYQQPPPAPTTQSLLNQACAQLPGGCAAGSSTQNP